MFAFFEDHKLLLAPMAGVSDEVFRQLCIEQGADLAYTEMISAKGLNYNNERTRKLITVAANEKKLVVQIFGHEPKVMAHEAYLIADQLGECLAYVDINMGCPMKKIVRRGGGCALMLQISLARKIIREVCRATNGAVSVKFRRGYALGEDTAVSFARMAEEAGAAVVAVHGRYAEQMYHGFADWDVITRVKQALSIPVIGNGDIKQGEDAAALRKQTACDALMIGRSAKGNPWIFSEAQAALRGESLPQAPSIDERLSMAKRHARLLSCREGKNIVRMRKHAMWYLHGLPGASFARNAINTCTTLDDFIHIFDTLGSSEKLTSERL